MAARLSVVMVHSPPAGVAAGQLAESIVGELIGLPEIDLTLIGPLNQLSEGSTDRLTLESLAGDIAMLDWQPASAIVQSLRDVGFMGNRTPHRDDPDANSPPTGVRRIYAFDLSRFSDAKVLCEALHQLKTNRQVRTFTLSPDGPTGPANVQGLQETGLPEHPSTQPPAGSAGSGQRRNSGFDSTALPRSIPNPTRSDSDAELDDLLDQLDELDP